MNSLINDGTLIGFWPLLEPSGAPLFKNYSPVTAKHPSGLSFDLHVNVADNANQEEMLSHWPGGDTIVNAESGTTYIGYSVQGDWTRTADQSSPHSRHLLVGGGGRRQQEQFLAPAISNSGFSAGGWIYPASDGHANMVTGTGAGEINFPGLYGWILGVTRAHGLFGLFSAGVGNGGWRIGLSGVRAKGAQFDGAVVDKELEGQELRAYVALESTGLDQDLLSVPVESGRFTHIGFTFKYIEPGSANEIVLYKDGRVTASGTTSEDITIANTGLRGTSLHKPFGIGHSNETTQSATDYPRTSGWGNLVSGVYYFRRVLHEGEMQDLHDCGGLQPEEAFLKPTTEITIDDPLLLGYWPHCEPGFSDASRYHRPLSSKLDLGDATNSLVCPGPHGFGGGIVNATNLSAAFVANSGLCYDIASASFTIGGWFAPENSIEREDNMMMSWGSVTAQTDARFLPLNAAAPLLNTMGLVVSVSGVTDEQIVMAEVYPLGDVSSVENIVLAADTSLEYYDYGAMHVALAYDDQTNGVALYVNGAQQSSGTIPHSLSEQLTRISGSGFPLIFCNGITDQPADISTRGLHQAGGNDMWFGPMFAYGRALLPAELRAIATSGIDLDRVWRTPHDPRLMGYWAADDFKLGDVLVEDRARVWNELPGHLMRGDAFAKQERWYNRNDADASVFGPLGTARYNQFGVDRTLPAELASEGTLGITSGVYGVMGGSLGTANVGDAANARSSIGNLALRFKPTIEQRTLTSQNLLGEYIIAYEVTPSGDIPDTYLGTISNAIKQQFNSALHVHGNLGVGSSDGEVRSFLTTINAGVGTPASGTSLVVAARDGTFSAANITPLVSGNVVYGVPNKVLIHGKFDDPYALQGVTAGTSPYTVSLWINGVHVQSRGLTVSTARMWSDQVPDAGTDDWLLTFGGEAFSDTFSTQLALDSGLGEIYMRNMFVMRGRFDTNEVATLAADGIQSVVLTGFTNQPVKTQVSLADSNLEAYYRFNGFAGGPAFGVQGSGTTDLSFKSNHLLPFAEILSQRAVDTEAAHRLHMVPGPLEESDLGVRASGITYSSFQVSDTADDRVAPFMASGTGFDAPNNGFSVGFLYVKKDNVGSDGRTDTVVAYGPLGTNSTLEADVNLDRGWAIGMDSVGGMKMVISTGGNMYLDEDSAAAHSGQVACGAFGTAGGVFEDLRSFDQYKLGNARISHLDAWTHWCWTYDPVAFEVRCYMNGELIDIKGMKQETGEWSGPQVPANPAARYLTFLQHTNGLWDFSTLSLSDFDSVITEFCYFSDALTPEEVRYIAQNGIDSAVTTGTSGVVGGYTHGLDTGSGIVGMYEQGQDATSGIIGGFLTGSMITSGIIGGYISGVTFGDGMPGGFMMGGISASGLIGGYMFSADQTSGIVGGFMLGGFNGLVEFDGSYTVEVMTADDFDAQLHVLKTNSTDFDAKIVIFQDEIGPLIDIEIPSVEVSGLVPPFNQYFIGKASGQQGKTITQTRWNFGDLTPVVSVAESGAGRYPVQHNFTGSGYYIVKFEAIDSDGQHGSATRIVNAASGIEPVILSLSGVPRSGSAALTLDFTTTYDIIPSTTAVITSLLDFDDGQKTSLLNPTHVYTEPGVYRPIWCVRDSRGVIWCDSLEEGNDLLEGQK